ncbi:MAG: hypothetical protein ACOCV8_04265, partial [Spirochaetota bacterium]
YEMDEPYDIVFLNETIYVTDSSKASVFAFDNYGTFIKEYKSEKLSKPRGISVSLDKKSLIIVDEEEGLLKLNLEGSKIEKIGDFKDIKGRFLSAIQTYDGRILGVNESITGIYAFIEEVLKASGLSVRVLRSVIDDTQENIKISHLISINDKLGRPIVDVTEDDITIKEQEIDLGNPLALEEFPDLDKSGTSIIIVNEKSNELKEKKEDIRRFIRSFVNELGPKDSLQIINVNQNIHRKNNFNSDPLETVYLFEEDEYTNIENVEVGEGLMFGIGQALSIYDRSSAVLFISSGNTPDESLGDVTAGDIYNYALANNIPIHTVVFSGKSKQNDFLTRLASESEGRVIDYYKSPEINKIVDIIRDNRKQYYIISYNTIIGNSNEFRYKEAIIEINTNNMTGSAKIGYFDRYRY